MVWTLDHWSAAIWSLPTNINAAVCGFKALQYGSSFLQSTAAHNIAQGGVFVEPVPRIELKRSQMLCNTEHLNFAVQLPSRLLFQEFWFSRWGKLKQLFYFMFEGVKLYHRKEPLQPIPDVLNLFKVGALKGGFRIDLECLATLG